MLWLVIELYNRSESSTSEDSVSGVLGRQCTEIYNTQLEPVQQRYSGGTRLLNGPNGFVECSFVRFLCTSFMQFKVIC